MGAAFAWVLALGLAPVASPPAGGSTSTTATASVGLRSLGPRPSKSELQLPPRARPVVAARAPVVRPEPGRPSPALWLLGLGAGASVGDVPGGFSMQLRVGLRPRRWWGLGLIGGTWAGERAVSVQLEPNFALGEAVFWPSWFQASAELCRPWSWFEMCVESAAGGELVVARGQGDRLFSTNGERARWGIRADARGRFRWTPGGRLHPWVGLAGVFRPLTPGFNFEGVETELGLPTLVLSLELGADLSWGGGGDER